jgi:hypothetical protein
MNQRIEFRKPLLILLCAAILAGGLFLPFAFAHAALYNASALLGQVDANGNPIWTAGGANNSSSSVNAQGFGGASDIALDTVNHRLFISDYDNRVLVYPLNSDNSIGTTTPSYVL